MAGLAVEVRAQVGPDLLGLAAEDVHADRPEPGELAQQLAQRGAVGCLAVQLAQVAAVLVEQQPRAVAERGGGALVVADVVPAPSASTRSCQLASAIRCGVPSPASTSSRVAAIAIFAWMRADSSTDSTSSRYSGAGVSASLMPASAA
ncbi:hypothetical protein GCM10017788_27960 [Amycolatopsis acidiphila]|nr:hypothetical protein GCM10017788_27960 [Amycolatopsis acidiphila]